MININVLETKIGYTFKNKLFLKQALTHRSAGPDNYERFEFVGDGLLDYVIALNLYQNYQNLAEGELSKIRAALVNQESLAGIARELELGQHLILGDGEEKSNGRNRDSILADSLEAIIAAISLDADFSLAKQIVENFFTTRLINADKLILKDSKTILQEYVQANKIGLPEYRVLEVIGPDHDSVFNVECVINELNISIVGCGKSKKEASQKAAQLVLDKIERKKNGS